MSERSFLNDLWPFEKKKKKKVQKFQSGIFGLFLTAIASRLSGNVLIFQGIQAKKPPKNIENGSSEV